MKSQQSLEKIPLRGSKAKIYINLTLKDTDLKSEISFKDI